MPPLVLFKMPLSVTAPEVAELGAKPVEPALNVSTPPVRENSRQVPLAYPSYATDWLL